jgi:ferrous iron transport protein A
VAVPLRAQRLRPGPEERTLDLTIFRFLDLGLYTGRPISTRIALNENHSQLAALIMTLKELTRGQSARIEQVDSTQPGVVRLMVLGLIEGAEVQYENAAIGGDPMEISVYGTAISVRRQQADHFRISPITRNV